jgi:hypothetical protein
VQQRRPRRQLQRHRKCATDAHIPSVFPTHVLDSRFFIAHVRQRTTVPSPVVHLGPPAVTKRRRSRFSVPSHHRFTPDCCDTEESDVVMMLQREFAKLSIMVRIILVPPKQIPNRRVNKSRPETLIVELICL